MASLSTGSEYHLTCGLCCQDFDSPVTLKCLHSFCQSCIQSYIDKRSKEVEAEGCFLCPVCDEIIQSPCDTLPISRWAEKLPSSQFLKCLADTITGKSSGDLCALCSDADNIVKATVWCQNCHDGLCDNCSVVHGKMKVTKTHGTVPISKVSEQERNKSGNPICLSHPDHCIEFYCDQCCVTLCQTCAIVAHRKCKNIESVSKVARTSRSHLHQSLNEIKSHVIMAEKNLADLQIKTNQLEESKHRTDQAIKDYVNDIIKTIRQSESRLLEKCEKEYEITSGELITRQTTSKKTFTALRQVEKFIASVITMGSDTDILNNTQLIEIQKHRLLNISSADINLPICVDVKFVENQKLSSVVETEVIGSIKPRSSYKLMRLETHLEGENKGDSSAIDLVIVTVNNQCIPIVVDGTNNCIKLLSNPPRKITLRNPRRIEKLNNQTVIVTASKHVMFIDVIPQFQVSRMVETQSDYTGIAVIGTNRLAASRSSFSGGCFIDVIDFSGTVLQKLVLKDLLDPSYLSATYSGNILISDCKSKAVTCLTHTGEILFTYRSDNGDKLKLPYGVCSSIDECIYLADYNGARVLKLNKNGEYMEDCLTKSHGIDRPRGVAFDDNDYLYVCHCKGWINVFRIS
ncbi:hypothetical protein LOTGIDRAFT_167823 [Lottia gigantea]|uniref:RING-type domain-containing protein n=1 Tax=Lottia gigantea TaxID=225164 RepID=V3Z568_LOTGI|nr:hypothetical protein LOTGIDRAFT_167823 [Lottia gigantea]ESO85843.1 hypothetical protein LOTGIDRAFT_167823 [Lottia gigantea]